MREINKIIIHSTGTQEGENINAKDINDWHKAQGFNEIGYHFIITIKGEIQKGRAINKIGAHCRGQNKNSIGIAYVGGCDVLNFAAKDTRTTKQKIAIENLCKILIEKYPTITKIAGHNKYCNTACPSFDAEKEYQHLIPKQ